MKMHRTSPRVQVFGLVCLGQLAAISAEVNVDMGKAGALKTIHEALGGNKDNSEVHWTRFSGHQGLATGYPAPQTRLYRVPRSANTLI